MTAILSVTPEAEEIWKDIEGYEGYYKISDKAWTISSIHKGIIWNHITGLPMVRKTKLSL